jgi:hypothetical protein
MQKLAPARGRQMSLKASLIIFLSFILMQSATYAKSDDCDLLLRSSKDYNPNNLQICFDSLSPELLIRLNSEMNRNKSRDEDIETPTEACLHYGKCLIKKCGIPKGQESSLPQESIPFACKNSIDSRVQSFIQKLFVPDDHTNTKRNSDNWASKKYSPK